MEVILIEDVDNLGGIGSLVKVTPGYARNFLLPKKLAMLASTNNKRRLEHEKRLANFRRSKAKAAGEELAKRLEHLSLRISRKVGDQDKLFGSVTVHDVQAALATAGFDIDRRGVNLPEPIKALGDYTIAVRLPGEVKTSVKVSVVAE